MALVQIIIIVVLMFTGQMMFFEESFNVVTTQPFMKDELTGKMMQTNKMDLNTLCFNTFMLMNIFNMLNCRVNTNELNIFSNLFNNMYFWLIVCFEFAVQVAFIWFTKNPTVAKLLFTTSQSLAMVITAWTIGAFVLPLRALFTKAIPPEAFNFMDKLNLETNSHDDTCVVRCYSRIFRVKVPESNDDDY